MKDHGKGKYICFGLIAAALLLWALFWPIGNKMTMYVCYASAEEGTTPVVYLSEDYGDFCEEKSFKASVAEGTAGFNLRWKADSLTGLKIVPTDKEGTVSIYNLSLYVDDTMAVYLDGNGIAEEFEISDGSWYVDESGLLVITPDNENCCFTNVSEDTLNTIRDISDGISGQKRTTRVSSAVLILILAFAVICNSKAIFEYFEKLDTWSIISILLLLATGVGVWMIAFHSSICHPDEDDVVKCLNYGLNHLIPPDMRSAEVAETYSGYGYTKLANSTWYYLLAGKIAKLASLLWPMALYYRVPNFLLFAIMGLIFVGEIKDKKWLTLALGICAQAWYIFSYTTADALDFFLCFIVLTQITDEDSLLYRTINASVGKKNIFRCLILGILFGFIFLGKQNYWEILVLAFVDLLFKLTDSPKEDRRKLLSNYGLILAFFVVTVMFRYAFDIYHYGFNISEVKEEMSLMYSAYDKNPSTPVQDIAVTYKMAGYGHTLPELFMAVPSWFKTTFRSFAGVISDTVTKDAYFKLMGVLYMAVLSILAYYGFGSRALKKEKIQRGICFALLFVSILASVLNSYVSDSQPQGRYLLPMLFITSYIGYKTPKAFEGKYFRICIIALQALSTWYFTVRGVGSFL